MSADSAEPNAESAESPPEHDGQDSGQEPPTPRAIVAWALVGASAACAIAIGLVISLRRRSHE